MHTSTHIINPHIVTMNPRLHSQIVMYKYIQYVQTVRPGTVHLHSRKSMATETSPAPVSVTDWDVCRFFRDMTDYSADVIGDAFEGDTDMHWNIM